MLLWLAVALVGICVCIYIYLNKDLNNCHSYMSLNILYIVI